MNENNILRFALACTFMVALISAMYAFALNKDLKECKMYCSHYETPGEIVENAE